MLDSSTVKKIAKDMGADLVGIAPMSRFEGAPGRWIPSIMPNAKSMIVVGFRINRERSGESKRYSLQQLFFHGLRG